MSCIFYCIVIVVQSICLVLYNIELHIVCLSEQIHVYRAHVVEISAALYILNSLIWIHKLLRNSKEECEDGTKAQEK